MAILKTLPVAILALAAQTLAFPLQKRDNQTYEAEDGVLTGVTVSTTIAGFTGTGYVDGFVDPSDKLTFTVSSDSSTLYDLTIRYASPTGDKKTDVVLNNGTTSEIALPNSATFVDAPGGQVLLNAGSNTIDIVSDWGYYAIDSITLAPTAARPPHNINPGLVNPAAGASAVALYKYLDSVYGKHIVAGQQQIQWSDWIMTQTGQAPALVGEDLMDYSPSRVEHGANATTIEDVMTWYGKGGISALVWHWNAPTGLYDSATEPWYKGFYTAATDFNIATALADTTNANYTLIIRDLDAIAVQLGRLQDQGIPVLWRPLHEAEGTWFWWGAQGPEPCKKLYSIMYDRFTNYHQLNNLIWVWNSVNPDWYPGDDIVDIVSTDVYATGNGPMSTEYNELLTLGADKKMIGAAEVGSAPLPDQLQSYQADWLWFTVWGDGFINSNDYNPPDVLKEIYTSNYTLTLDTVQGWANTA